MLELEVLVGELSCHKSRSVRYVCTPLQAVSAHLLAVDGLPTSSIVVGEVTALEHELRNDTVENRLLVAETVGTSAQLAEVACRFGCNAVLKLEDNLASRLSADGDLWKRRWGGEIGSREGKTTGDDGKGGAAFSQDTRITEHVACLSHIEEDLRAMQAVPSWKNSRHTKVVSNGHRYRTAWWGKASRTLDIVLADCARREAVANM